MRLRIAPFAAAAAFALIPAATAAAAPDRTVSLAPGAAETWDSEVKSGFVYTSSVASRVPACTAAFGCDVTLVETTEYGNLKVDVVGKGVHDQNTLNDVDVHIYVSNENGAQGDLYGEDTSPDADETVLVEDLPAGFYLVVIDWYFGIGSIDATAALLDPTTPMTDPPPFEPAEDPVTTTPPERQHAFATTEDEDYTWTGATGAGFADVQPAVGCNKANCDYTLFKVDQEGILTLRTVANDDTLIDGDIHLYESDEHGAQGYELGAATAFTPDETLGVDVAPGYYLMMYNYSGAGSYTGTASLDPLPEGF